MFGGSLLNLHWIIEFTSTYGTNNILDKLKDEGQIGPITIPSQSMLHYNYTESFVIQLYWVIMLIGHTRHLLHKPDQRWSI